ncbi:unnamed protein product, partial [Phaeothamnion confervicola]
MGNQLLNQRRFGDEAEPMETGLIPDARNQWQHDRHTRRQERRRRRRGGGGGDDDDDEDYDVADDDEEAGEWRCGMVFARDDAARIFSMSTRGKNEFPDYHANLRLAVGLARYVQDPLTELAGMWTTMDPSGGFGGEMLFLQLHPLQAEVGPVALLRALERCMMDAVSDVGVDLMDACEHPHRRGLLQFVAGLGPKKAAALRRAVGQSGGTVAGRQQLLEKKLMGHQVYTNAASFLRFRRRILSEDSEEGSGFNPFDGTRVHPECYTRFEWALKMCGNALEVDIEADRMAELVQSVMEDSYEATERLIMSEPGWDPDDPQRELDDKLSELDLNQYAAGLEQQGHGRRLQQLELIKAEIRFPYRDRRRPYRTPPDGELFEWLTGETDATLRQGAVVTCRVTGHIEQGVKAVVEGGAGLWAFIRGSHVQDEELPFGFADFDALVPRNQVREAVILEVRKDRFELLLSLRPSDLNRDPREWGMRWSRPDSLPPLDQYFDAHAAAMAYAAGLEERRGLGLVMRSVRHPNFKNMSFAQAEQFLRDKPAGEAVFRPSSKGAEMLSLSWKWAEGPGPEVKHIEVEEYDRAPGAALGQRLVIKDETYGDLDEILSRYVAPCNDLVAEVLEQPKYKPG